VGTDAFDLSALAGTRGGMVGATLRTRKQKDRTPASRGRGVWRAIAYLKVEKPHFLFLEGSTGAVAAADTATVALPDASAARAGTSAACAAPSVDRPVTGASAPALGACCSAASTTLGEGGAGSHLSGGPLFLPPLPLPTMSTPTSPGEKVPAAHTTGIPRPFVLGAPTAGSSAPSCALPAPATVAAPRARARARGVGGSDRAAFTVTLCWGEGNVRTTTARHGGIKEKGRTHLPAGRREA
jgi:hypothetical protein